MKKSKNLFHPAAFFLWIGFCAAAGTVSGFAQTDGDNPLMGSWYSVDQEKNHVDEVIFASTTVFFLDFESDGFKEAWGDYKMDESQISLTHRGGQFSPECSMGGVYSYSLNDNELYTELVNDACEDRKSVVLRKWTRAKPVLAVQPVEKVEP